MSEPTKPVPPARPVAAGPESELVDRISALVEQARESIAAHANATLTLTFWQVGHLIDTEVLGQERAQYGAKTVATLSRALSARYGRGFEEKNLRWMVKFAQTFADRALVATLSRQLSWSRFVALLPLPTPGGQRLLRP